jgi:PAS domain S-box-containing protein
MTEQPLRITLIDDDEDCFVIVRDLLADAQGIRNKLTWHDSYEKGLAAIGMNHTDVFLLDYRLGANTGLDLLREARARKIVTPFILLTGQGDQETAVEAMKFGATDYLVKGQIDVPLIERSLRHAVETARNRTLVGHFVDIMESTNDLVSSWDAHGLITYLNRAGRRMLGIGEDEDLSAVPVKQFHPPASAELIASIALPAADRDGHWNGETELLARDGRRIPALQTIIPHKAANGQIEYFSTTCRDITERKRAEESNVRLAAIVEFSDDAIIGKTLDGIITSWNRGAEWIFGYPEQEAIGRPTLMLFPPERVDEERAILARIASGGNIENFETVRIRKDQKQIHVSMTISPLKDSSGKIIGASKIANDITARKQAEEAVRLSETRYHTLFDTLIEGFCTIEMIFDADGKAVDYRFLEINPAFEKQTGLHNAQGKLMRDLAPNHEAHWFEIYGKVALTGEPAHFENEAKALGRHYDVCAYRVGGPESRKVAILFNDIGEQRKLEQQLRQSQKMESIGQLASGVAHDFNNILAVIQMQTDLLKTEGDLSPAQAEFADEISASARRAANLTRQLLLFSRKETLKPRDLDFNESINELTKMLRRVLGEDIQLQFKFAMQPLFVHADASMMDQVLMNLAVNSRDAMPKGGQLVIETSAVEFDESAASHSAQVRPGAFVCLSVSDTGCGISPENLSRIFEPFFTTKDVGKGTGLGLATVFGIVQQHKGWVNVYSEVGRGTTFRIYLPRLAKTSGQKFVPTAAEPARGGNETILFVEDELSLRASVRNVLSRLGYRVLEASDGASALEVWKQNRDEIHLLLTDMVLPGGINGKELGERLLKENPKLKVIYASGYSAEVASKDFPLEEGVNFLTKPFQAQKLAQTVRQKLDVKI